SPLTLPSPAEGRGRCESPVGDRTGLFCFRGGGFGSGRLLQQRQRLLRVGGEGAVRVLLHEGGEGLFDVLVLPFLGQGHGGLELVQLLLGHWLRGFLALPVELLGRGLVLLGPADRGGGG